MLNWVGGNGNRKKWTVLPVNITLEIVHQIDLQFAVAVIYYSNNEQNCICLVRLPCHEACFVKIRLLIRNAAHAGGYIGVQGIKVINRSADICILIPAQKVTRSILKTIFFKKIQKNLASGWKWIFLCVTKSLRHELRARIIRMFYGCCVTWPQS